MGIITGVKRCEREGREGLTEEEEEGGAIDYY